MPLPGRLRETKDPHIRELILAAQGYETAGMLDPGDFEAVYNHGLALQELALRCTETRENQEIMFRQVRLALYLILLRILSLTSVSSQTL